MIFPPAWRSWLAWHKGGYPNNIKSGPAAMPALENVTVNEQREIVDAAWLILKAHNATADVATYWLANEIATKIVDLRDRQIERKK